MDLRVAIGLALLAAPGCPGAAQTDGPVVNVYNWADYIGTHTIARFEAEYGIKVNYDIYDSAEIVDAKLMAGASGYDVVMHAASNAVRLIPVGLFRPLDRSRLSHWKDLDPDILAILEGYDPGNLHAAPYMWGTTGFSYNVDMIAERMRDAPLDSARMIFDPEVVARFADCGVSFLDAPTDVIPMVLIYLGLPPHSVNPEHLQAAGSVLKSVRPYVRYFDSTKMLLDLPNKEVCIAMSWSGDYATAQQRARDAGIDIDIGYTIPAEGSTSWFDTMLIPTGAPHPLNAHLFIDFILRADVIAEISNLTHYANAVLPSLPLLDPDVLDDAAIYPTDEVLARLHPNKALPPKVERLRTRVWSRVKLGL